MAVYSMSLAEEASPESVMPFQFPGAGVAWLEVKSILLFAVPRARRIPLVEPFPIWNAVPVLNFTVTPGSIVSVEADDVSLYTETVPDTTT